MSDIVRAGLLTHSNGQPLSSGGMIDIEVAAGQTVRITRPVEVSIPSPGLEKKMQLYKGVADGKGKIDWTDPKPLPDNPQMKILDSGASLFQTHCACCHADSIRMVDRQLKEVEFLRPKNCNCNCGMKPESDTSLLR